MPDDNNFSLNLGDLVNDHGEKTGEVVTTSEQELESSTWLLGVQGSGKSSLIEHYVWQLSRRIPKRGIIVIDPHSDLVTNIIRQLPADRIQDTYLLDIDESEREYFFGINIFDAKDTQEKGNTDKAVDRVVNTFFKLFEGSDRGITLPKVLRFITRVMIANPGMSLADVPRLLEDASFRAQLLEQVTHYRTLRYWEKYDEMSSRAQGDEIKSLTHRLETLLSMELLEYIMGQEETTIDFRRAMDNNEIILIRLPVSDEPIVAPLIGTALVTEIFRAVFSYRDTPREQRKGFTFFVDEAHNFVTDQFARLITEGRKYGVRLFIGNQTHNQLKGRNYDEILNCRTRVALKLNDDDAKEMASAYFDTHKKPALKSLTWDILPELKKRTEYEIFLFNRDVIEKLNVLLKEAESDKEKEYITHTLKSLELVLLTAETPEAKDRFNSIYDTAMRWCSRYFGFSEYYRLRDLRDKEQQKLEKVQADRAMLAHLSCEQYVNAFLSYYYREPEGQTHCYFADEVVKNDNFWQFVRSGTWDKKVSDAHNELLERIAEQNRQLATITLETMIEKVTQSGFRWENAIETHTNCWLDFAEKHSLLAEDSRLPWVLRDFHSQWAQRIQYPSFDVTQTPAFAYLKLTKEGISRIPFTKRLYYHFYDSETYIIGEARLNGKVIEKSRIARTVLQEQLMRYTTDEDLGKNIELPAYYIFPDTYTRYCEDIPREGFEVVYIEKSYYPEDFFTDRTLKYIMVDDLKTVVRERVWDWFSTEHGDTFFGDHSFYREVLKKQKEENEWIADMFGTKDKWMQYREQELLNRIEVENTVIAAQEEIVTKYKDAYRQYQGVVDAFGDKLITVCALLQIEPIGEYEKPETVSDLARKLSRLVERFGFVRVGGKVYQMMTPDRPAEIDKAEYDRRFAVIREQTRKKYCKSKEDIEKSFAEKRKGGVKKKRNTTDTQKYDITDNENTTNDEFEDRDFSIEYDGEEDE